MYVYNGCAFFSLAGGSLPLFYLQLAFANWKDFCNAFDLAYFSLCWVDSSCSGALNRMRTMDEAFLSLYSYETFVQMLREGRPWKKNASMNTLKELIDKKQKATFDTFWLIGQSTCMSLYSVYFSFRKMTFKKKIKIKSITILKVPFKALLINKVLKNLFRVISVEKST